LIFETKENYQDIYVYPYCEFYTTTTLMCYQKEDDNQSILETVKRWCLFNTKTFMKCFPLLKTLHYLNICRSQKEERWNNYMYISTSEKLFNTCWIEISFCQGKEEKCLKLKTFQNAAGSLVTFSILLFFYFNP